MDPQHRMTVRDALKHPWLARAIAQRDSSGSESYSMLPFNPKAPLGRTADSFVPSMTSPASLPEVPDDPVTCSEQFGELRQ
jgi:hypothetical protein